MAKKDKIMHTLQEPGVAMYAYLTKPDEFVSKEGGAAQKKYKLDVRYPKATAYLKSLVKQANQLANEQLVKAKATAKNAAQANKYKITEDMPFGKVLDSETGEPTGEVYFRFKTNYEYKDRQTGEMVRMKPPVLFDAHGNVITDPEFIAGNGSVVSVCFEMFPYTSAKGECGVSFRMQAVQIIKHVPYVGGVSFDQAGFQTVEDGDDLSTTGQANPFSNTTQSQDDDDDPFGGDSSDEGEAEGTETLEDVFSNTEEEEAPAPAPAAKGKGKGRGKGKAKAAAAPPEPITELDDSDF